MRSINVLFLAFILPLAAQDFLDPLVVTATRTETPAKTAAYSSELFSSRDFQENTVRTLPDALRYTPGVLVQKTAHGHGSPFIRGFTGRQNLLLIDGVRFNNSTFRGGPVQYWNTVDPYSFDRFELIRSQGSVLYGSDAAGGTLNAFTKFADFENEVVGQVFSRGSAYYEYRSNGRGSHIGRVETQTGVGGKFGLHLGISMKEFGDIEDSSVGLMRGTGYPEEAIDARIDYAFSSQTKLTLVHQYLNQDNVSRWHSTFNNPGWIHGNQVTAPGTFITRDIDQERSLTYFRIAHENERADAPIRSLTATFSYQTSSESEFQNRKVGDRRYQTNDTNTTGIDLELTSNLAGGSLVYGLDYYHDSVDSYGARDIGAGFAFDPSNRPLADDSTYDLLGAYAQYIRPFGEKFELTTGVRYTYARAELGKNFISAANPNASASDSWDDISASVRGTYRINDEWLVFGGVSQAFRAPNLNDLSGNVTSRSGTPAAGSLTVEPEEFTTVEVGVRKDSGNYGFSAAVYYTDISNQITSVLTALAPNSPTVTTNGSDGYIYGIELEGFYKLADQWTLSGFASWQEGCIKTPVFIGGPEQEEYLSRLLPLSGSVALRWDHVEKPLWIEGRIFASAEADKLSSRDRGDIQRIPTGGTPAYAAVSLRAGYNPTENIQLTAALENLLDDDYRLHGSGQNEPGFNAIFGVKYLW
ncbi:MAG: TonB-dependent receptor [Verrucomicrobia bacterium]|jgi:hemoglobin/transferrin/lactoferrin receptor protein|nr:TonB-dependent receptor [Verrucomicrobiota bacterium]|tara:strand:+ start:26772 stop:28868 length:2097 start_codon:yes stop_codon:yes gene_type:complete